jgi:hypothetical protein
VTNPPPPERTKKHPLEFQFNQLFGRTSINVEGQEIRRTRRLFSESIQDTYEFALGEKEPFVVRIEKRRGLLLGSRYSVFINRRLLAVHKGH